MKKRVKKENTRTEIGDDRLLLSADRTTARVWLDDEFDRDFVRSWLMADELAYLRFLPRIYRESTFFAVDSSKLYARFAMSLPFDGTQRDAFAGVCRCLSTFFNVCRRLSTLVDVFRCLSTFVDVCRRLSTFVDVCRRFSMFVDVCWHLSTFVDVCRRLSKPDRTRKEQRLD